VTFICVAFAWGFFKATSTNEALTTAGAMLGLYGFDLPVPSGVFVWLQQHGLVDFLNENLHLSVMYIGEMSGYYGKGPIIALIIALIVSMVGPNSNEMTKLFRPTHFRLVTSSFLFSISILFIYYVKDFVYFQF
jgi:hypothetical protein